MKCKVCKAEASVSLRSHNAAFCDKCYREFFRRQIIRGIESQKLFTPAEKILVALSGGKDSLALMLELSELGYNVTGLFIDLAIPDSSQTARSKVEVFCQKYGLPIQIIDLASEGLAIPKVKKYLKRPICSACGKIKRHFFNYAALAGNYDALATGHNLDDEVSRLASNILRWDEAYLAGQGPNLPAEDGFCRKVKPLWRLGEFEIANYAFITGIDFHCAVCPYSAGASFSFLKSWMHKLELKMPGRKLDFYLGFLERGKQAFAKQAKSAKTRLHPCAQCGSPTSADELCGVCRIREAVRAGESRQMD